MTVMHATRAIRFALCIQTKDHLHDLAPIGAVFICIEQPKIGLEVPLVVRRDMRQVRGMVVKCNNCHGEGPRQSFVGIGSAEYGTLASDQCQFLDNSQIVRPLPRVVKRSASRLPPNSIGLHRGKQDSFVEYTP